MACYDARIRLPTIIAGASIAFIAACGGTAERAARPTPAAIASVAASPTASTGSTPSPCPVATSVCDFARQTRARLASGDVDGIIATAKGRPVTCTTGVNPGLGADFPLCTGAVAGEVRYGFEVGRFQSEGTTADRAGLARSLGEFLRSVDPVSTDALGGGDIRLFTIGCPDARAAIDCAGGFALVYSAILKGGAAGPGAIREFLMLTFAPDGSGTPRIAAMHTGLAQLNMLYLTGGVGVGLRTGDGTSPPAKYLPLSG